MLCARLYRTDGRIETYPVSGHFEFAKDTLSTIVALDENVYRAQLVDQDYDRLAWDSYESGVAPALGTLAFDGAAA